jgi:hypothetical protein
MYDMALRLAEKDQPVPPAICSLGQSPYSALRRGLVLVALALALSIARSQIGAAWPLELILIFMGIGYLIAWVLDKKQH